ncbi:hypothetical protein FN846DRAFT_916984 [Sphaerosporella brunnea]|uniref:C2H2-type domain-containing protein n=1 Tax=Sphaerosporella brunnea TaxID=1250544 RepID=A0A5J5F5G5_9PEZI|nr:hypothetical protein FN846DRAFT_916984 [Sphaerosporella brunnea]
MASAFSVSSVGCYQKTYRLSDVTGDAVEGYITLLWVASDLECFQKVFSWTHLDPLINTSQAQEQARNCGGEPSVDDEESEEHMALMAVKAWKEAEMAECMFSEELERQRNSRQVEFPIAEEAESYETEMDSDSEMGSESEDTQTQTSHEYHYNSHDQYNTIAHTSRQGGLQQVHSPQDPFRGQTNLPSTSTEEYETESGDSDLEESDEDVDPNWGKGPNKRTHAVVSPPTRPSKRANVQHDYPCVVPSCDKGYANKASLQRHVLAAHDRVTDPVVRLECRRLWAAKFKGGRMEEIEGRYGPWS